MVALLLNVIFVSGALHDKLETTITHTVKAKSERDMKNKHVTLG